MTINLIGEALDTVFSLLGKGGRFLNAKGKKICWPIWSVCAAYWALRNLHEELYSQAFFAATSVILNLYGMWSWKKKGYDEEKPPEKPIEELAVCKKCKGEGYINCFDGQGIPCKACKSSPEFELDRIIDEYKKNQGCQGYMTNE